MRQGLMKLLGWLEGVQYWLADALGHQVEPLHQELCHVSQAVEFLVISRLLHLSEPFPFFGCFIVGLERSNQVLFCGHLSQIFFVLFREGNGP